jgi:hypothetical protein
LQSEYLQQNENGNFLVNADFSQSMLLWQRESCIRRRRIQTARMSESVLAKADGRVPQSPKTSKELWRKEIGFERTNLAFPF